jgi:hypothetical protein
MSRPNTPKPSSPAHPRKGMRLHKIPLPDTNSPEFIEQARLACLAVNNSPQAKEDQDFVDSISILPHLPEYRW